MANVKISDKGKALLRKGFSSGRVVNEIVKREEGLYTKEGLSVSIDGNGTTVRVRTASSVTRDK